MPRFGGAAMSPSSESQADTPERLITAAEELFFERGIESVSLREIGRKALTKNVLAVQYWFKDRDGLISAILDRHRMDIDVRRHTFLDIYVANGRSDIRGLAEALVRPLAAKLDQGVSGAGYLRVVSDLLNGPTPSIEPWGPDAPDTSSTLRWRELLEPLLDPQAIELHRRFHALRFVASELAQRARTGRTDHRLFVSQLIDMVVGLLSAEVSDETRKLIENSQEK